MRNIVLGGGEGGEGGCWRENLRTVGGGGGGEGMVGGETGGDGYKWREREGERELGNGTKWTLRY